MKIHDNGDEEWIFHSSEGFIKLNKINENVFWACTLGSSLFWGISAVLSMIISQLFWIALCITCFLLSSINLALFLKCRGKHQEKFIKIAEQVGLPNA